MKKIQTFACILVALIGLTFQASANNDLPKPGDILSGSYKVMEEGVFGKRLLRSIPLPEGD